MSEFERATLHGAGDCSAFCTHPDHDYDGEPIDLSMFLTMPARETG